MCGLRLEQLTVMGMHGVAGAGSDSHRLTGNGAADFPPSRSDAGTVPDHAILGPLVGFSHSVVLLVDFIIAPFLYNKTNQWKICF